jgi:hypothetical protein
MIGPAPPTINPSFHAHLTGPIPLIGLFTLLYTRTGLPVHSSMTERPLWGELLSNPTRIARLVGRHGSL